MNKMIVHSRSTSIIVMMISVISILAFTTIALAVTGSALTSSTAASCGGKSGHEAGSTGLTADLVVSKSHQLIQGTVVNAAGYDVGIYVCPGTTDVRIIGVTVTGANQHGIFVQDASDITVQGNLVTGNGVATIVCPPAPPFPAGCIPENKPIELVGTSDSVVSKNVVSHNSADGGIGVADDGPQNPGAPLGVSGASLQSKNDKVTGNTIDDNSQGCGIVIAAYNANVGVKNILVEDNTIIGQAPLSGQIFPPPNSYIGQIVVAADGPDTTVSNTRVIGNSLDGSELPGIVVHSNVFGDKIDNTQIRDNTAAENGYYPGPPSATPNTPGIAQGTTGISIVAEVGVQPPNTPNPIVSHTHVDSNTVLGDTNGVWLCGTDHTEISDLQGNPTNPQVTCNAGGS
jgi:parallel beta-helix repeat protein